MMLTNGYEKFILIEVWVTPGTKNKPESRTSRHTYFEDREQAFAALKSAEGDMNRLLENVSDDRQVWHQ
jgi:hypothetical protein